jgi:hypothetical protein
MSNTITRLLRNLAATSKLKTSSGYPYEPTISTMSQSLHQPAQPPPSIRLALMMNRLKIEAAIQGALSRALGKAAYKNRHTGRRMTRPDEVSVLIHFFALLPALEDVLNELLRRNHVGVKIKGVFCHKSGSLGPVVDFDVPPGSPGCELADLLMLVTHGNAESAGYFGNGCFLQAKVERGKINQGASSRRQSSLYCQGRSFKFRDFKNYISPDLPDHHIPGYREMPGADSSGFAFWSYDAFQRECGEAGHWRHWHYDHPFWSHASALMLPTLLNDPTADLGFGHAMYRLLEGSLGIGVRRALPNDFGWNRIVHDVVLRALQEPLGDTKGIVSVDNLHRASADVNSLIGSGIALVSNPFRELAAAFGSKAMYSAAEEHAKEVNRMNSETLDERLKRADGGDRPPPNEEDGPGPEDSGSSGSFIQINLFER